MARTRVGIEKEIVLAVGCFFLSGGLFFKSFDRRPTIQKRPTQQYHPRDRGRQTKQGMELTSGKDVHWNGLASGNMLCEVIVH